MKMLVTGGSGFLGSHVADALSDAGHEVWIFDIQTSKYLRPDQKMIIGDILDQEFLLQAVSGKDMVFHFAGIADIDECSQKPVETTKYNILGTVMLLEACRYSDIKRFIFASSAYVYSNYGYFYRTSKNACESFITDYSELYGLKYTCLRYGSLYGNRADKRNSIYNLIRQAIEEGKITYHGTGEEIREFIHVQDAAQISIDILEAKYENQELIITGTEKMRYKDILEMIREMFNNSLDLKIMPSKRKAHYKITPYNFTPKLGKKLVCNPHIDIGQGLLLCMADIYEQIHKNELDKSGIFIND